MYTSLRHLSAVLCFAFLDFISTLIVLISLSGFYSDRRVWQVDMRIPRRIVGVKNTNGGAPIRDKNGLWSGGLVPYTLASSIRKY